MGIRSPIGSLAWFLARVRRIILSFFHPFAVSNFVISTPDKVVLCCRFPSVQKKANLSSLPTTETTTNAGVTKESDAELSEAVELAKKALVASQEAVSLADDTKLVGAESDDVLCVRLAFMILP